MQERKQLLKTAIHAAFEAGKEILEVYEAGFTVEQKEDRSPLTEADRRAHQRIVSLLAHLEIPVLSEEGRDIPFEERKAWEMFWMVDPLDGTKEFIKRNGEFTVNIALIEDGKASMGVIYVPVKDQMYFADETLGSYLVEDYSSRESQNETNDLPLGQKLPLTSEDRIYTIVGSRSHMSAETEAFIKEREAEQGDVAILGIGSSLKLCMVAAGKADVYPRFAPTMEWDTAAGQAIVEAAGGKVLHWESKKPMQYNKEQLLNDWFLVTSS